MPRKKLVKAKKVKRQTIALSAVMEKDFKKFPKKIQEQLIKDLAALKKQEPKLQGSLQKLQKQHTAAQNKHDILSDKINVKPTQAAKKQLAVLTKTCNKFTKAISALTDQLNTIKEQGKIISLKKARFSALSKYISSLDKEWARSEIENNKAQVAKKPHAKQKKKTTEVTEVEAPEQTTSPESSVDLVVESVE